MTDVTTKEEVRHWGRWALSGLIIVAVVGITIPVNQRISELQEVEAAKSVVWNEVSYPQGNVASVEPTEVSPGEVVYLTFKEYCNAGVDTRVERWVDFLLPSTKEPYASFGLDPLEFYGASFRDPSAPNTTADNPSGCVENQTQPVGLPDAIAGRPPGDALVRIRISISYEKPEQTIIVPGYSEPFILLEQCASPICR